MCFGSGLVMIWWGILIVSNSIIDFRVIKKVFFLLSLISNFWELRAIINSSTTTHSETKRWKVQWKKLVNWRVFSSTERRVEITSEFRGYFHQILGVFCVCQSSINWKALQVRILWVPTTIFLMFWKVGRVVRRSVNQEDITSKLRT